MTIKSISVAVIALMLLTAGWMLATITSNLQLVATNHSDQVWKFRDGDIVCYMAVSSKGFAQPPNIFCLKIK